jgi:hypothetical protein
MCFGHAQWILGKWVGIAAQEFCLHLVLGDGDVNFSVLC